MQETAGDGLVQQRRTTQRKVRFPAFATIAIVMVRFDSRIYYIRKQTRVSNEIQINTREVLTHEPMQIQI